MLSNDLNVSYILPDLLQDDDNTNMKPVDCKNSINLSTAFGSQKL